MKEMMFDLVWSRDDTIAHPLICLLCSAMVPVHLHRTPQGDTFSTQTHRQTFSFLWWFAHECISSINHASCMKWLRKSYWNFVYLDNSLACKLIVVWLQKQCSYTESTFESNFRNLKNDRMRLPTNYNKKNERLYCLLCELTINTNWNWQRKRYGE